MTYLDIATMKDDPWLRARVAACAALEGIDRPDQWAIDHRWKLAAQPGWAASWASALVTNAAIEGYEPGKDQGCVTDAVILSAVQALIAEETV
ncbi:hypothetical protein [Microbacterium halotolerans]|uniref:hypothetical protein n=1 Tax=Microbacterium halotolerans TaxID=246613 RepID=UPI000E6AB1AF|nr:hypothetical protein [Microbacterium halotolerans]